MGECGHHLWVNLIAHQAQAFQRAGIEIRRQLVPHSTLSCGVAAESGECTDHVRGEVGADQRDRGEQHQPQHPRAELFGDQFGNLSPHAVTDQQHGSVDVVDHPPDVSRKTTQGEGPFRICATAHACQVDSGELPARSGEVVDHVLPDRAAVDESVDKNDVRCRVFVCGAGIAGEGHVCSVHLR